MHGFLLLMSGTCSEERKRDKPPTRAKFHSNPQFRFSNSRQAQGTHWLNRVRFSHLSGDITTSGQRRLFGTSNGNCFSMWIMYKIATIRFSGSTTRSRLAYSGLSYKIHASRNRSQVLRTELCETGLVERVMLVAASRNPAKASTVISFISLHV